VPGDVHMHAAATKGGWRTCCAVGAVAAVQACGLDPSDAPMLARGRGRGGTARRRPGVQGGRPGTAPRLAPSRQAVSHLRCRRHGGAADEGGMAARPAPPLPTRSRVPRARCVRRDGVVPRQKSNARDGTGRCPRGGGAARPRRRLDPQPPVRGGRCTGVPSTTPRAAAAASAGPTCARAAACGDAAGAATPLRPTRHDARGSARPGGGPPPRRGRARLHRAGRRRRRGGGWLAGARWPRRGVSRVRFLFCSFQQRRQRR